MSEKLKITPLGGLNEIGKNMTAIEYEDNIVVIDCGLAFPDDSMLGVDLVIPDITYLKRNIEKVRAIVITHAHEDHIGALPYVLKELSVPVYCTKLAAGIIETKLKEHRMNKKVKLYRIKRSETIRVGSFNIEFIPTNHSIPDSVALAITTPLGVIVHTGDFKVDMTPVVPGDTIDLTRFGELGKEGVLVLMSDSTNVERPGYTLSEKTVGEAFDFQFKNCDKRIIVATFASNIYRLQQIIDAAEKFGRKVAASGRSMENILDVAIKLGYIKMPQGMLIPLTDVKKYSKDQIVIMTTGSQGEPMSALVRMANSTHKQIEVGVGDKILIAATPIPGNEKSVYNLINELYKKGAEVVYDKLADMHVSGHACQEELKLMLALVKPKYFIPVHGEFRHLKTHAKLAEQVGVRPKNIFVTEIGRPVEFTKNTAKLGKLVPAGKVLVDGLGVGDVGTVVLRDRKLLSQDGVIIVAFAVDTDNQIITAGPDIISRGFIFLKGSEDIMQGIRTSAENSIMRSMGKDVKNWNVIKNNMKNDMADYLYKTTKRNPVIIPIIMDT
ncbi:MAG: ribonuclease J [Clostridia bacterium]